MHILTVRPFYLNVLFSSNNGTNTLPHFAQLQICASQGAKVEKIFIFLGLNY